MPGKESKVSRRSLLRGGAIAGALGVGAAMSGGTGAFAAALPSGSRQTSSHSRASGPIVIYLADPRSGEIDVFAGTAKSHYKDRSLAARVASLAPRA